VIPRCAIPERFKDEQLIIKHCINKAFFMRITERVEEKIMAHNDISIKFRSVFEHYWSSDRRRGCLAVAH